MENFVEKIMPEDIEKYNPDYVFICTQAGAIPARKLLKELGKK